MTSFGSGKVRVAKIGMIQRAWRRKSNRLEERREIKNTLERLYENVGSHDHADVMFKLGYVELQEGNIDRGLELVEKAGRMKKLPIILNVQEKILKYKKYFGRGTEEAHLGMLENALGSFHLAAMNTDSHSPALQSRCYEAMRDVLFDEILKEKHRREQSGKPFEKDGVSSHEQLFLYCSRILLYNENDIRSLRIKAVILFKREKYEELVNTLMKLNTLIPYDTIIQSYVSNFRKLLLALHPFVNYYEIIGVSSTANSKEIKKRVRRLRIDYHPDRVVGDEHDGKKAEIKFMEVCKAGEILLDKRKRMKYDADLEDRVRRSFNVDMVEERIEVPGMDWDFVYNHNSRKEEMENQEIEEEEEEEPMEKKKVVAPEYESVTGKEDFIAWSDFDRLWGKWKGNQKK